MSQPEFSELLHRHLDGIRVLSPVEIERLYRHYELLVRWNQVLNLTAIHKLEDVVLRHYCESLLLATHMAPGTVLDVGSGAGFPGIPVAVVRPDCAVTLAESHKRKAVFLREATRDYANVKVVPGRASSVRGPFDWVISRAVRWHEVLAVAERRVGLLVGEADAAEVIAQDGFEWQPVILLPWGRRRVLLLGSHSR